MEAIRSASIAPAVPVAQILRSLATTSLALCAAAFLLLIATAFSDTIRRSAAGDAADWAHFFGQFAVPLLPLGFSLALLAVRRRASASAVALGGSLVYLLLWVTIAY